MKKQISIILSTILVTGMSFGCQKTPDMEYVTNKEGYNTLIQDNAAMDNGTSIRQQVQAPEERIIETLEGTNDYTTIEIDAAVSVPEGTAIPVYQLHVLDMNPALAEDWVQVLFDDGRVQNLTTNYGYTEEEYYAEMERLRKEIEDGQSWNGHTLSETEISFEQMQIENYMYYIETGYVEKEAYGEHLDYTFQEEKGELLSDGLLYSNTMCDFRGERNGIKYKAIFGNDGINQQMVFAQMPDIISLQYNYSFEEKTDVTAGNKCQFSTEEAEQLCSEFLKSLELEGLTCGQINDVAVHLPYEDSDLEGAEPEQNGYCLHFYRSYDSPIHIDGISEQEEIVFSNMYFTTVTGDGKNVTNRPNILYQYAFHTAKKLEQVNPDFSEDVFQIPVMQEVAMFIVTDDGIVSVAIINPAVSEECLAENVKLVSFDRVLEQAETQLAILYGDTGTSNRSKTYQIQVIELNYARMQSPDKEGEYVMIPVWNFKTDDSGVTLVSINAIDGTVFHLESGH